ncbi:unnamed protein product [Prunus armeniaca]|uniref:Uncharacterized protein n=1 Tax=Prunus armeniaca TaxID=36596 RepID=A0A6J5Y7W8_PRUAR|nr:unnamed protein product [Prunus armeniaca]
MAPIRASKPACGAEPQDLTISWSVWSVLEQRRTLDFRQEAGLLVGQGLTLKCRHQASPGLEGDGAHLLLIKTCRSASLSSTLTVRQGFIGIFERPPAVSSASGWLISSSFGLDPWAFGRLDLELELAVTRELSVPRQALAVSTHSAGGTWHSSFGKRDLEYLLLRQGDLAAGFRAFQFQQGAVNSQGSLAKNFFELGFGFSSVLQHKNCRSAESLERLRCVAEASSVAFRLISRTPRLGGVLARS